MCRRRSQAGTCCGARRTDPGGHLEFKAKTVTDILSLPVTASVFMLCDENTHLYLTRTLRERGVRMGHSRYHEFDQFLLCFARNLVPSCAFFVLSSPKAWSNKCVQMVKGLIEVLSRHIPHTPRAALAQTNSVAASSESLESSLEKEDSETGRVQVGKHSQQMCSCLYVTGKFVKPMSSLAGSTYSVRFGQI